MAKSAWKCGLLCFAPCFGVCAFDTASPVLDAIGTASGYANGAA
jgi:hypothetical protein